MKPEQTKSAVPVSISKACGGGHTVHTLCPWCGLRVFTAASKTMPKKARHNWCAQHVADTDRDYGKSPEYLIDWDNETADEDDSSE